MDLSRREALTGLLAAGATIGGQAFGHQAGTDRQGSLSDGSRQVSSLTLDNGFRAHIVANGSRYISAALVLRSSEIRAQDGLAHLLHLGHQPVRERLEIAEGDTVLGREPSARSVDKTMCREQPTPG